MKPLNKRLSKLLAALTFFIATACVAGNTVAGNTEAEEALDWYQVEVIIFSQQDLFANERHVTDIKLGYPENIRQLTNPDNRNESNQTEISKLPIGVDYVGADYVDMGNLGTSNASDRAENQSEQAFAELPEDLLALNDEHQRLRRAPGYRVLYHKAWQQPGLGTQDAPWILIQGGETSGDRHELEGSFRLVRNRYLHAQANLWKIKFGEPSAFSPTNQYGENNNAPYASGTLMTANAPAITTESEQWPPLPSIPVNNIEPRETGDHSDPGEDNHGMATTTSIGTQTGNPNDRSMEYSVEDIVTLNQSTRLSRDELTYLDHPNMGVIILVKKYEALVTKYKTGANLKADGG